MDGWNDADRVLGRANVLSEHNASRDCRRRAPADDLESTDGRFRNRPRVLRRHLHDWPVDPSRFGRRS